MARKLRDRSQYITFEQYALANGRSAKAMMTDDEKVPENSATPTYPAAKTRCVSLRFRKKCIRPYPSPLPATTASLKPTALPSTFLNRQHFEFLAHTHCPQKFRNPAVLSHARHLNMCEKQADYDQCGCCMATACSLAGHGGAQNLGMTGGTGREDLIRSPAGPETSALTYTAITRKPNKKSAVRDEIVFLYIS
jgi:hypothetical protein